MWLAPPLSGVGPPRPRSYPCTGKPHLQSASLFKHVMVLLSVSITTDGERSAT